MADFDFDIDDAVTCAGFVLSATSLMMLAGVWAFLMFVGLCMMALGAYRSG